MSRVQNDTRKFVKPKDTTEGIARMMVLDLRPFDIVEDVGFNALFILLTNPFPNPNSFGNPDSFENPTKFENFEIFESRSRRNFVLPTQSDISGSGTSLMNMYNCGDVKSAKATVPALDRPRPDLALSPVIHHRATMPGISKWINQNPSCLIASRALPPGYRRNYRRAKYVARICVSK